jgi:hypothetical protein
MRQKPLFPVRIFAFRKSFIDHYILYTIAFTVHFSPLQIKNKPHEGTMMNVPVGVIVNDSSILFRFFSPFHIHDMT